MVGAAPGLVINLIIKWPPNPLFLRQLKWLDELNVECKVGLQSIEPADSWIGVSPRTFL